MSAVTLADLRADFEATMPVGVPDGMSVDDYAVLYGDLWCHPSSTCFKAQLYVIARDFGYRAATAFKISEGLIDPRKGGAL